MKGKTATFVMADPAVAVASSVFEVIYAVGGVRLVSVHITVNREIRCKD